MGALNLQDLKMTDYEITIAGITLVFVVFLMKSFRQEKYFPQANI